MTCAPTRWSRVVAAGGADDAAARAALGWLCEAYWQPLVAQARRRGSAQAAEDRVQSFFLRLLERRDLAPDRARGRFRNYLFGAFAHFLANAHDREQAAKRGGGAATEALPEIAVEAPPDRAFLHDWARAVTSRAFAALRHAHEPARFAALAPCLTGEHADGYAAIGARLGLGEVAVKVAVHRLRAQYRALLEAEIAETLEDPSPAAIAAEIADLLAALRPE